MIYPNKPLYLLSLWGYIYYLTYYTLTTKDNIFIPPLISLCFIFAIPICRQSWLYVKLLHTKINQIPLLHLLLIYLLIRLFKYKLLCTFWQTYEICSFLLHHLCAMPLIIPPTIDTFQNICSTIADTILLVRKYTYAHPIPSMKYINKLLISGINPLCFKLFMWNIANITALINI